MQTPRLFVSIFAYVMGKENADPAAAVRDELAAGENASWPAFRTLARVRAHTSPMVLMVNHSSLIGKARSLALGAFVESGAPLWLSIDDDVEASSEDVGRLLGAEDVDVLIAPCALRGGDAPQLNIAVSSSAPSVRDVGAGVRAFPIVSGGFALSVMSRRAAAMLYEAHPELRFVETSQGPRRGLGVYLEEIRDGSWWGEDYAFCRRARAAGLRLEALCDTAVTHAGVVATVDPRFFVQSDTIAPS
jgi:hypothetical protein